MTVTLCLVLLMLGSTPSGLSEDPSVGCGLPYHIWSLGVGKSAGNCIGGPRKPPKQLPADSQRVRDEMW